MYFVYLLYSKKLNKHYIGYTNDLEKRLKAHLSGKGGRLTRMTNDWVLKHFEEFETMHDARSFEAKVKLDRKLRADFYSKATKQ